MEPHCRCQVFLDKTPDAWHDSVAMKPPLWTEAQALALADRATRQAGAHHTAAGGRMRYGLIPGTDDLAYISVLEMEDWAKSSVRGDSVSDGGQGCFGGEDEEDDELQELHDAAAAAAAMEMALSTLRRECAESSATTSSSDGDRRSLRGLIVDVRWNRGERAVASFWRPF